MIKINIETIQENLNILKIKSDDVSIGKPYRFYLICSARKEYKNFIGKKTVLFFSDRTFFNGYIDSFTFLEKTPDFFYYKISIESSLNILKYTKNNRIFTDKTVIEIIEIILKKHKFTYKISTCKSYSKLSQITQYQETDLNFFLRILSQFGLIYCWEKTSEKLMIVDDISHLETGKIKTFIARYDDGFSGKTNHVFCLEKSQKLLAESTEIQYVDECWNMKTHNPFSQSKTQLNTFGNQFLFHADTNFFQENKNLVKNYQESLEKKRQVFQVLTHDVDSILGELIKINQAPDLSWNQIFRIIKIDYHYDKNDTEFSTQCVLVKLTLISANKPYRLHLIEKKKQNIFLAKVFGNRQIDLDQYGRYQVQYQNIQFSSKRIFRSQLLVGLNFGSHYPIHQASEVMIYSQNNDIDQPIIAGVLANQHSKNTVIDKNRTQNRIRTHLGHQIILDDYRDSPSIHLETAGQNQIVALNYKQDGISHYRKNKNPGFIVQNKIGDIHFESAKNVIFHADKNYRQKINYKNRYEIGQSYVLKTNQGSVIFDSEECRMRSEKDISFHSHDFDMQAKQYIRFQNTYFNTLTKRLSIHSDEIIINTHQFNCTGEIKFQCGASNIVISKDLVVIRGSTIYCIN